MESFQNWLLKENRYLDEGFVDSLKQGYQQSYQQAQKNTGQNLEKFGNMALPAIKKATAFAQTLSKKTGIPMPLATALIASGIVGGPAAVPFAYKEFKKHSLHNLRKHKLLWHNRQQSAF